MNNKQRKLSSNSHYRPNLSLKKLRIDTNEEQLSKKSIKVSIYSNQPPKPQLNERNTPEFHRKCFESKNTGNIRNKGQQKVNPAYPDNKKRYWDKNSTNQQRNQDQIKIVSNYRSPMNQPRTLNKKSKNTSLTNSKVLNGYGSFFTKPVGTKKINIFDDSTVDFRSNAHNQSKHENFNQDESLFQSNEFSKPLMSDIQEVYWSPSSNNEFAQFYQGQPLKMQNIRLKRQQIELEKKSEIISEGEKSADFETFRDKDVDFPGTDRSQSNVNNNLITERRKNLIVPVFMHKTMKFLS